MPFYTLASARDHAVGLTNTAKTATTVTLSWTDRAERETKQRVEYRLTAGGPNDWTLASKVINPNVTLYEVTGLTSSSTYQFRVAPTTPLFASWNQANYLQVTTNATPAAGTNDGKWVRPFDLPKGKWRVRTPRIAGSDSIVEKGQSTQDLE